MEIKCKTQGRLGTKASGEKRRARDCCESGVQSARSLLACGRRACCGPARARGPAGERVLPVQRRSSPQLPSRSPHRSPPSAAAHGTRHSYRPHTSAFTTHVSRALPYFITTTTNLYYFLRTQYISRFRWWVLTVYVLVPYLHLNVLICMDSSQSIAVKQSGGETTAKCIYMQIN